MFLLILCFCLLSLLISRPFLTDSISDTYVSRDRTSMINGIFIWIVFISHLNSYSSKWTLCDSYVVMGIGLLGQLCVASFFFYSGYGIMLSLRNKGRAYAKMLLTQRFSALLLHFTIAVSCYLALNVIYGVEFDTQKVILSFIGWESLGNSNWFIFVTLCSYIIISLGYTFLSRYGDKVFFIFF